jgi:hypothetical protein
MPARKTAHAHVNHDARPGTKYNLDATERYSPRSNAKEPTLRTKKVEVIKAPYGPRAYSLR